MKPLSTLLADIAVDQVIGDTTTNVLAVSADSRHVTAGTLFVAIRGTQADGHAYIAQAIAAGSTVVVCEQLPTDLSPGITYVKVPHSAQALGHIAASFYDHPSRKMRVVAVTGTNGKTSTVYLLYSLFQQLGYPTGMLSTIHNKVGDETLPARLTTPDPVALQSTLARMADHGCQYCFMEASSHAIVQERLAGLQLSGAVFLNITHDHLDYHHTFDNYIKAKKKLFDELPPEAFALFNVDDKRGTVMVQNTAANPHSFALKQLADFTAKRLSNTLEGLELQIGGHATWFRLIGNFNAYNLLATYAAACLLGEDSTHVLTALSALPPIPGRFQHLRAPAGFSAIVDYAHTPDALKNVLSTIVQVKGKAGKIVTVVGCGGDRDPHKRPIMAQIACQYGDKVIFTADNPRGEAPEKIIQDMKAGLKPAQQRQALVIIDRAEAIKTACSLAQPHDIVLVAGKGHETYQEIQGKRCPFDDCQVLSAVLGQS